MRTENDGREKTAAGNAPASGTELRGLRILLLEDNTVCAEITKALLEALGAAVDCAPDGDAGVRLFLASPPGRYAAVLTDLRMPVLDGCGAARAVRASGRADAGLPILALSSDDGDADVRRALEAGMDVHLAKPADPRRIAAELRRLAAEKSGAAAPTGVDSRAPE